MLAGREYLGLDEVAQQLRRDAPRVSYLKLYDRNEADALARFELRVAATPALMRQGNADRLSDEDEPDESDDDGLPPSDEEDEDDDSDAGRVTGGTSAPSSDPYVTGYPTLHAAVDAAIAWLRSRSGAYVVGSPGGDFMVKAMAHKGTRIVFQARFRVVNNAHLSERGLEDTPAAHQPEASRAALDALLLREDARRDERVDGPRVTGTSDALSDAWTTLFTATRDFQGMVSGWGRDVLVFANAQVEMVQGQQGAVHKQMMEERKHFSAARTEQAALDITAGQQARESAFKAEVVRETVVQLGGIGRIIATRGDPRLGAIADAVSKDEELLDTLAHPDVVALLHDKDNVAQLKVLLKAAAAQLAEQRRSAAGQAATDTPPADHGAAADPTPEAGEQP